MLQPTAEEMEQWYWMGINDDITQGFVYGPPPQDANPPVNPQTRKRRRTGTVQDEKLPKKLKPEKVKEAVVATSSISKSSPMKRTTPSQSRRSRSKTPLSPPRISSPEPIGAKDKQMAVADHVADTSVKAAVVKVADVAAKIVHTPETLVTMTDKDLDVLVDKIVADVGVMDVACHTPPQVDRRTTRGGDPRAA
ncbi:hypothetical protein Dimus_017781 [Dionaea muscipula]